MSNVRDFASNLKVTQVVDPVVITSDANGASVDMKGYGSVAFYALVGESGDTLSGSVYIELEIEDSDNDSDWADAVDADVRSSVTGNNTGTFAKIDAATEDDAVFLGQYDGSSRYVRPVINVTGTHTNGTPIGIIAVQSMADVLPVT